MLLNLACYDLFVYFMILMNLFLFFVYESLSLCVVQAYLKLTILWPQLPGYEY